MESSIGRNEYHGEDPYVVLEREMKERPVPAIEKPLGLRQKESTNLSSDVVLIDNQHEGVWQNWNDHIRGREWTG